MAVSIKKQFENVVPKMVLWKLSFNGKGEMLLMKALVYHYCSLDTFINIIKNKTLRFSEITKSNDSMELAWLKNKVVPRAIEQEFRKKPFDFLILIDGVTYQGHNGITQMVKWFSNREDKDKMFETLSLGCCFSEHCDLLSQWRGYGDDARGMSIGFDKQKLENIFDFWKDISAPLNFVKVIYDESQKNDAMIENVRDFLSNLKEAKNSNDKIEHALLFFLSDISMMSPMYKNKAFQEEGEWRAYINYPYPTGNNPNEDLVNEFNNVFKGSRFSNLYTYIKNSQLVFFCDFEWGSIASDIIKEVYIGSKSQVTKDDIEKLFTINKIDNRKNIKIRQSSCSYK